MPIFSFIRVHLKPSIKQNYFTFLSTPLNTLKLCIILFFTFIRLLYNIMLICLTHFIFFTQYNISFSFLLLNFFNFGVRDIFKGIKRIASNCKRLDNFPLTFLLQNCSPFVLLPSRSFNLSEIFYLS